MKTTYDVIGAGEGISGLVACSLLAGKGFSCLWADTSQRIDGRPVQLDIPLLITRGFWEQGVKLILGSLDRSIIEALQPRKVHLMQSLVPGQRIDIVPENLYKNLVLPKKIEKKYLSLLTRTMIRPAALAKRPWGSVRRMSLWEKNFVSGLSRTGNPEYRAYLRYMASLMGMYVLDYGRLKETLGSYLYSAKGDYIYSPDVQYRYQDKKIEGISLNGTLHKSRYYLRENLMKPDSPDGFVFYGRCEVKEEVIPVGMGDLLVVSPVQDMDYPIVLSVERISPSAVISVMTKVRVDNMFTSLVEQFSWASEMIMKRLRQVIPFIDEFLVSFDALEPFDNDTILPWFAYKDDMKAPWFFSGRHYIRPLEKVYVCDRMKFSWIDVEGEILWGICVANAILKELNRSDLIIKTML